MRKKQSVGTTRYRLALDLGTTSIGWAVLRLSGDGQPRPTAVIRAGVRIFPDGRNPKDGSSLAVTRRLARSMRRRRDRLLKRKRRMMDMLVRHGFFPEDALLRKQCESLNPYELRSRGLHEVLQPHEFARALFHINQRRGFKSNRKTDSKDNESGAMKTAISQTQQDMERGNCRTVGEWLWQRMLNKEPVRARYRKKRETTEEGKSKINKSYDLYINRKMIADEFDLLWDKQSSLNPALYTDAARHDLRDTLLFQRNLKPVKAGRCTLMPEHERAPLALPSVQQFRIYQEVNNLRILDERLRGTPLNLEQRDTLVEALSLRSQMTFKAICKLLGLPSTSTFNLQDEKRDRIKGNASNAILSKKQYFGKRWNTFLLKKQDAIVEKLLHEESTEQLSTWLQEYAEVDADVAAGLVEAKLPDGYGRLSKEAIDKVLPALKENVCVYSEAVLQAGFSHHSKLGFDYDDEEVEDWIDPSTGEVKSVFKELPYYGKALQRYVAFGSGDAKDPGEKRYGKIANPTVHIALNQVRKVVNALIRRYGRPTEIVVELARELKQSQEQKKETQKRQAANQKRNERIRKEIAELRSELPENVSRADVQKWILWEELSRDPIERVCPFSGTAISKSKLLSAEVEVEHILPFSRTLDDSLNNKTVSTRAANRIKRNRSPYEASSDFENEGWAYDDILQRTKNMPRAKAYRFAPDAMQKWEGENDFLARALNDTKYISRVAKEYLGLICPGQGLGTHGVQVVPGQMTAKLRYHLGLNGILGLDGEKNRDDHRHHAVDACVIGVTDRAMLRQFSNANKAAADAGIDKLVKDLKLPWETYTNHVKRAVANIWVSHKPDHGYQGGMHNDTAYALLGGGKVGVHKFCDDGSREFRVEKLGVIKFADGKPRKASGALRHGTLADGTPKPYKGYKGDSNYCIEIVRDEKGKWKGEVLSTFEAYQLQRKLAKVYKREHGKEAVVPNFDRLLSKTHGLNGQPLVMRLMRGDCVRLEHKGELLTLKVCKINAAGQVAFAQLHESNVDARTRKKELSYVFKTAGSMQKSKARRVTVSPIGELKDPGFQE